MAMTYHANCHCGAFKLSFATPAPIDAAVLCDCSACSKNGYVFVMDPENVVFTKGVESALGSYSFGRKVHEHKFCKTCGTSMFLKEIRGDEVHMFISLRAVQTIDVSALANKRVFDGSKTPPAYVTPTPPSPPAADSSSPDAEIYSGSCHCGAITYAFRAPKISSATECNCSICTRLGALWTYIPTASLAVKLTEETAVTEYMFGTKQAAHTFCSTCGVDVYTRFAGPESSVLSPVMRALNVRTLNGVDISAWEVKKADGKAYPPEYVVPE
ncbi:hypothetical protein MKEN_01243300 [Mycena kentingensis (nom. inval.)]|nr:hypothetical protein MKEN_01243300 [Mycena kentingensis (nom. inval.)]